MICGNKSKTRQYVGFAESSDMSELLMMLEYSL